MRSYAAVAPGQAVPYRHRDPAWLTPAQLAALQARDRPDAGADGHAAALAARILAFGLLRAAGYTISQAAREMGISRDTGRKYDRARRQP